MEEFEQPYELLKCRFYLDIKDVNGDFRPAVWPIKYPYWCSGETNDEFVLIAYTNSIDDLMKQWPEAKRITAEVVDKIEFSDRFPKPDWYKE